MGHKQLKDACRSRDVRQLQMAIVAGVLAKLPTSDLADAVQVKHEEEARNQTDTCRARDVPPLQTAAVERVAAKPAAAALAEASQVEPGDTARNHQPDPCDIGNKGG